jgi:A/G-specific adenine glycosylase
VLLWDWFRDHGRSFAWRTWTDPYRLAVVELLLQRTRAETVAAFVPRFLNRYPNWASLARASRADLETILASIGLQSRRAASLTALASAVINEGIDPASPDAPGVGQYISRALAVAARNEPVAMIDSNWVRIVRRIFGGRWTSDYRYDPRLQAIAEQVVEGGIDSRSVNWAVLDFGATVCLPRTPRCEACLLAHACDYAQRIRGRNFWAEERAAGGPSRRS